MWPFPRKSLPDTEAEARHYAMLSEPAMAA